MHPSEDQAALRLNSAVVENCDGRFIVLRNDGIGGNLCEGKRWEAHFTRLVEGLSLRGTIAVDAGANIGCNTVTLGRAVGDQGLVIAFEPQRIPYQQLCGNAVLNGLINVVTFQNALGDRDGVMVQMDAVNYFAAHVNVADTKVGGGGDHVEMRTLDSFNLSRVSFVKIDVQGSELAVLNGARATIARTRPLLFVEIEEVQCAKFGYTGAALIEWLQQAGYALLHIQNDYPVDHVCIPVERPEQIERCRSLIESPCRLL